MKSYHIADLFCGAGGTSTGACEAAALLGKKPVLTAINHWPVAIETHKKNHPGARHLCTTLDAVNPRELYDEGQLNLLWGSPECTHHSVARGGRPVNDQSRATAWCIVRWAGAVMPDGILVENVPEYRNWGPLIKRRVRKTYDVPKEFVPWKEWRKDTKGDKAEWMHLYGNVTPAERKAGKRTVRVTEWYPDPKRKGETYRAWKAAIESFGYRSDEQVLCAADFGDPTTRKRLFVQFVRGRRKIVWPNPTHAPAEELGSSLELFGKLRPWVPARNIIDWTIEGQSIFERRKPLAEKTINRIWAGLLKFGLAPFIIPKEGVHGGNAARSTDQPLPTVISDGRVGLAQSFILPKNSSGQRVRSVDRPLHTITTESRGEGLVTVTGAFLTANFGEKKGQAPRNHSVDDPLPTATSRGAGNLITASLIKLRGTGKAASVEKPAPTVTGGGNNIGLAEFIVGCEHTGANGSEVRSVNDPVATVSAHARKGLVSGYMVQVAHGNSKREKKAKTGDARRSRSLGEPMPTVCGNRAEWALAEPALLPQQSGGALRPVSQPVPTVSTSAAIGLIKPCLIKFYGTGGAVSIEEPLDTVTAKARFGLVRPIVEIDGERYLLDIRFRMLKKHELALAQGFPRDYIFEGNDTQVVKQIGNAVPRRLSRAIVLAVMAQRSDISDLIPKEAAVA